MPDHALDSIFDTWDLPVNEEAYGTFAQLEIGKQLASMNGMGHIDRLVFDEDAFINQEIGTISTIDHDLFVADRNRIFRVDIQAGKAEFIRQALPINGLQQSCASAVWIATAESTIYRATSSLSITLSNCLAAQ